jgi:hypothetical protein
MFFRNEPTCYKNCFVETPIRFPKWPFPIAPSGIITLTTFLLFDDFFHIRRVAETSVEKRDFKNTAAKKTPSHLDAFKEWIGLAWANHGTIRYSRDNSAIVQ